MGLFTTVLHVYNRGQEEVIKEFSHELQSQNFNRLTKLAIEKSNYETVLEKEVFSNQGAFYLITQPHGYWTTIIELDVNLDKSLYLYEIVNELSKRLNTYALSFHLHDDDVVYYNLDNKGEALDGYNSDFQYFETEPLPKEEILSQRHSPEFFKEILPRNKNADKLNEILNEGMWAAFDNNDLDEDGVPKDDEKYYVNELERFERIGKYLEIFSDDDYPFANWYPNLVKLDLENCYLLKAER